MNEQINPNHFINSQFDIDIDSIHNNPKIIRCHNCYSTYLTLIDTRHHNTLGDVYRCNICGWKCWVL